MDLWLVILKKERDDEVANANAYKGSNEASELKTVVEHVASDVRCARSIKVDSGYFGGIVGDKEIAIDRREHGNEG